MRDGALRYGVKRVARAIYEFDLSLTRRWRRLRGRERWRLGGSCEGCAKCCEAPSIRVPRWVAAWASVRAAFVWWQRVVNGFTLVRIERLPPVFVFECAHFDPVTRRCDSYASRPGMCRDYPRLLLDENWPEFFPECGYRALSSAAPNLLEVLEQHDMSEASRAELERKLHLR